MIHVNVHQKLAVNSIVGHVHVASCRIEINLQLAALATDMAASMYVSLSLSLSLSLSFFVSF